MEKLSDDMYLVSNESSVFQLEGDTFYQIDFRQQRNIYQENKFFIRKAKRADTLKISSQMRMPRSNIHQLRDGSLIIERVNTKHTGHYLCFAKNSRGFNYRKAFVKVNDIHLGDNFQGEGSLKPELLHNIFNSPRDVFNSFNQVPQANNPQPTPLISTPIIFIVTISLVSIVIIIFLMYFYKSI